MTTKELIAAFGNPFENLDEFLTKHMVLWDIPSDINSKIPALPNRLFTNKRMVVPLERAFREVINAGLHSEILSFDGCYNLRKMRSGNNYSKHAWGVAIDMNAHLNPYKKVIGDREAMRKEFVKWSESFLDIWRKEFICGADWNSILDGMHFELKSLA